LRNFPDDRSRRIGLLLRGIIEQVRGEEGKKLAYNRLSTLWKKNRFLTRLWPSTLYEATYISNRSNLCFLSRPGRCGGKIKLFQGFQRIGNWHGVVCHR